MTQIVPVAQKVTTVRTLLDRLRPQLAIALPRHVGADRFLRVVMTSIQRTPKLLDCTQASLLAAVIQSAQLGLEPDGVIGHAYLVPYGKVAQLIIGYKGLIDLARRSGHISTIYAQPVYEKDRYRMIRHIDRDDLEYEPADVDDPGPLARVYAVARLRGGGEQFECMRKREIDAIRRRSRAAQDGPWVTDYDEMAKKTVLRRLCKVLPASVELQQAVAIDERADAGLPPIEDDGILSILDQDKDKEPAGLAEIVAKHLREEESPTVEG